MLTKLIICAIVALAIGIAIGVYVAPIKVTIDRPNGEIVLDKNDEGHDRIFFNLGMEYEEIGNFDYITFKVTKK